MEALSAVEKITNANLRNYLSSMSPGEGGVDLWSPVACIAFQPTQLNVPAYTQWVAQALHNLCPAVHPRRCWQLSFCKMLFLKQPNLPPLQPRGRNWLLPHQFLASKRLAVDVFCCHTVLIKINHPRASESLRKDGKSE